MSRILPRINGQFLRLHRLQLGLTIEQAAARASCSAKRWGGWENSSGPVFGCTLKQIAGAFDLDPKLITLDAAFLGLESEIKTFGTGVGLTILGVDPSRLNAVCAELMFGLAILSDYLGNADSAAVFCQLAVEMAADSTQKALASIRLAEFYGHLNKPAKGLKILYALEQELKARVSEESSLLFWARYQIGVLLLCTDEIGRAKVILRNVRDKAPSRVQRTSAKHQLANAALRGGAHRQAEKLFRDCLGERSPKSHRRAFEYHGLGEALAHQRDRRGDAVAAFREALLIARCANFHRYVAKIIETVTRLGLASDPLWKKTVRYVIDYGNRSSKEGRGSAGVKSPGSRT